MRGMRPDGSRRTNYPAFWARSAELSANARNIVVKMLKPIGRFICVIVNEFREVVSTIFQFPQVFFASNTFADLQ